MPDNLCMEDVVFLSSKIQSRDISPRELTETYLRRIKEKDPVSFITLLEEEALLQADSLEKELFSGYRRGPLHGIPVAVKDNIALAGLTIYAGSGAFRQNCTEDAEAVKSLKKAGAIILGTTNMHELGHGVTGENRHFGTPLNPWGENLLPGGSSSGSSTAVSSGFCGLALGSDTAGSVRIPASLCGNLSLKPTGLALPGQGLVLLCPSLDTVGLHARSASDLEAGWEVLSGDGRPSETFFLSGLDLGLYLPQDMMEQPVREAFEDFVKALEKEGASVYESFFDFIPLQRCGHNMVFYNASRLHGGLLQNESLGKDIAICLREGQGIDEKKYRESLEESKILIQALLRYFKHYSSSGTADLLLMPATPLGGVEKNKRRVMLEGQEIPVAMALTRLTYPASLAGLPALTFPLYTKDDIPVGLQVLAPEGQEKRLLFFAGLLEKIGLGFRKPYFI